MPWYTITDEFDADFGVDEWHGTNAFIRDGEKIFRTYFINNRGDEQMGGTWNYLDITALGRQEEWEDSPEGYPQTPTYKWWNWHDSYVAGARPTRNGSRCRTPERPHSATAPTRSAGADALNRTDASGGRLAEPFRRAGLRDHGAADLQLLATAMRPCSARRASLHRRFSAWRRCICSWPRFTSRPGSG